MRDLHGLAFRLDRVEALGVELEATGPQSLRDGADVLAQESDIQHDDSCDAADVAGVGLFCRATAQGRGGSGGSANHLETRRLC